MKSLSFSGLAFFEDLLLLLAGLSLAFSWLTPNHETPWLSFYAELLAAISGLFFLLCVSISQSGRSLKIPRASIVCFIASALPPAQWLGGLIIYRGDAILAFSYIAVAGLMIWTGATARRAGDNKISLTLVVSILLAAILSTGLAIYQKLGLKGLGALALDIDTDGRSLGNVGQANQLASLLMFGIFSVFLLNKKGKLSELIAVCSSMFLIVGVVLTGSRQPIIGLFIILAWNIYGSILAVERAKKNWGIAAFLLVWTIFCFFANLYFTHQFQLTVNSDPSRVAPGLRPLLWSQYIHSILYSPWGGFGWQGGLTAQASVAIQHPGLEFSQYAHDIFIDLMVWSGIPLGVFLGFTIFINYLKLGKKARSTGVWFEFAIVTIFLAHSLVEYPFAFLYLLMPVSIIVGQIIGEADFKGLIFPKWGVLPIALAMVFLLVLLTRDYIKLTDERRELIAWSMRMGGDHSSPEKNTPILLDQLAAFSNWMREDPRPGMSIGEIDEQLNVSRRFPTAPILLKTVMTLAMNGRVDQAYIELLRMRGLHGEQAYRMSVEQLRRASAASPAIGELIVTVTRNAAYLPRLPNHDEEMALHPVH